MSEATPSASGSAPVEQRASTLQQAANLDGR